MYPLIFVKKKSDGKFAVIKSISKAEMAELRKKHLANQPKQKPPTKSEKIFSIVMKGLKFALKKDKETRRVWNDNIAMSFMDNYYWHKKRSGKTKMSAKDIHAIANKAADHFINLLCDQIKYPKGR